MEYKPLKTNFEIPPLIENDIEKFLAYLNDGGFMSEDCYRTEIDCDLKLFYNEMKPEHIQMLRDYYVRGGMYEIYGEP